MQPLIDECMQTMINNFTNLTKSGATELDVKKVLGAFSMDVVITVAFGTKVDSLIDKENPIITNAKKIFDRQSDTIGFFKFLLFMSFPKLFRLSKVSFLDPAIMNFFKSLLKKIVDERRKFKGKVKRCDFLQLMLDAMDKENLDWESEEIKEVTDISAHLPDGEEYRNMVTHNKSN